MQYFSLATAALIGSSMAADYQWEAWKAQHKLNFQGVEEDFRYSVFAESRKFVNSHNQRAAEGKETFTVSLNKFAAMTEEEFAARYLNNVKDLDDPTVGLNYNCDGVYFEDDGSSVPDTLTWVGYAGGETRVTAVKDQGSCGSCWSFGSSAAIEGFMCASGLKDCSTWSGLSTQQMVDCASNTKGTTDPNMIDLTPYDNHACNGGLEPNAMRYVALNGGQMDWDAYPYVSGQTKVQGTCQYDASNANLDIIDGCGMVTAGDENAMKQALAQKGPMSVAIDASGRAFSLYSGGVYTSDTCSNTRLNHAVTGTGYGVERVSGTPYWEIKNSWGTGWGIEGYVLIARDAGNMCGVASEPHWVYKN